MSDAVTPDDADDALMHQREHRAARLDGFAEVYQAAVGLAAVLDQYDEVATEPTEGDQATRAKVVVDAYAATVREHVADEYPDAVRATLE